MLENHRDKNKSEEEIAYSKFNHKTFSEARLNKRVAFHA